MTTIADPATSPEAISVADRDRFDLVVIGAGSGGLAAAKRARPDTEVLVMTAYATIQHAVEAMQQGADHYIQKPFLNEQVIERIRSGQERVHTLDDVERQLGLED